jgi:subtilisin family serine protease
MTSPFPNRTGKAIRVAVIDSGVNAAHPHIGPIAGGVAITGEVEESVYTDVMGHGTAVMAAIQEKAPDAEYFAVRVFHSALRTSIDSLLHAIQWSVDHQMHVINLSLGTTNPAHIPRFEPLIERAVENGIILVSAREAGGIPALPGSLPNVIGVGLDWDCPRETYQAKPSDSGTGASGTIWSASGYPRDLPNLPRQRNLHGISFAVANMTGFVARACEEVPVISYQTVYAALNAAVPKS